VGAEAVAIGDLTGDGRPDLVVVKSITPFNGSTYTDVYPQQADGTLGAAATSPEWDFPWHPEIADLNRDGRRDLLVGAMGGPGQGTGTGIRMQAADGTLGPETWLLEPVLGDSSLPLAVGDGNSDSLPDIAVGDSQSGLVLFRQ